MKLSQVPGIKLRWQNKVNFGGNGELALRRDNYSCVKCGMNDKNHIIKYGRHITVDHKDRNRKNNLLKNLQTLCLSCHSFKDSPSILNDDKVIKIRELRLKGLSQRKIAKIFNICKSTIGNIDKGNTWSRLGLGVFKRQSTQINRICKNNKCGRIFRVFPSVVKKGNGKYCGHKCHYEALNASLGKLLKVKK